MRSTLRAILIADVESDVVLDVKFPCAFARGLGGGSIEGRRTQSGIGGTRLHRKMGL